MVCLGACVDSKREVSYADWDDLSTQFVQRDLTPAVCVPGDGGYLLNGAKTFVTYSPVAGLAVVFASPLRQKGEIAN